MTRITLQAVWWLVCAVAWLPSCSSNQTSVDLTVSFEASLNIDQLGFGVSLSEDEASAHRSHWPDAPEVIVSGTRVLLLVPNEWGDQSITVLVDGLNEGLIFATGKSAATLKAGEKNIVAVALTEKCPDACVLDSRECIGTYYRVCVRDPSDGCSRWAAPTTCPTETPSCSNGQCTTVENCVDECAESGTKECVESLSGGGLTTKYRSCLANHDQDDCLDWGPAAECPSEHVCIDGTCIPTCNGEPCRCEEGETKLCPELLECGIGQRNCVNGFLTACIYEGQQDVEACNGLDDNCDGAVDNKLPPHLCSNQQGVCAGAQNRCAGASGWFMCVDLDYQLNAQNQNPPLTYNPLNDPCDGQDNDCDGLTDEDASAYCPGVTPPPA